MFVTSFGYDSPIVFIRFSHENCDVISYNFQILMIDELMGLLSMLNLAVYSFNWVKCKVYVTENGIIKLFVNCFGCCIMCVNWGDRNLSAEVLLFSTLMGIVLYELES